MAEHIDWDLEKENQEKKVIARSARKKVTHTGCKLPSDFMSNKEKQQLNGEVITMDMNKPVTYKAFKLWPADLQKEYLEKLVKNFGVGVIDVANMMGVSRCSWHQFLTARHLRDIFPANVAYTKTDKTNWELFCKGEWKNQALQNTPESHENALGATNGNKECTDTSKEFVAAKGPAEAEKTSTDRFASNCCADSMNGQINKAFSEIGATTSNAAESIGDSFNGFCRMSFETEKCCCNKVQLTSMSLSMKNVKSWDDIFELIRKYPLPEHNSITIVMADEDEEE